MFGHKMNRFLEHKARQALSIYLQSQALAVGVGQSLHFILSNCKIIYLTFEVNLGLGWSTATQPPSPDVTLFMLWALPEWSSLH